MDDNFPLQSPNLTQVNQTAIVNPGGVEDEDFNPEKFKKKLEAVSLNFRKHLRAQTEVQTQKAAGYEAD
jgi:hypothetical protein